MNILFLDTYYVDGFESSIGIYNIFKDVILPSLILIGTILGSSWLAKRQFNAQKNLQIEKVKQEDESTLNLIKLTNGKLIENLKESIENFENNIKALTIDSSGNLPLNIFNDSFYKSLTDLGYFKIYWILKDYNKSATEDILQYWSSISYISQTYEVLQNYNNELLNKHNLLNDKLNIKSNLISTKSTEIIQTSYSPGTSISYTKNQLEYDPDIRLSTFVKKVVSSFIIDSQSSHLRKTKNLFEELDKLKLDKIISKVLNIQYAQNIADGLGIIKSIENLDENARKSYKNYISKFEIIIKTIEKIGFNTENKT